jgi:MarR-like DNA-binding transcriptional regulator SgrR of sgrS sRNA
LAAHAETRPHYGGSLRIALGETPPSFDPAALAGPSLSNLSRQVFETLVALDERGHPQPLVATSWQSEPGNQRWRFLLRSGVSFHDGAPLDAASVVASLRKSNPGWKVIALGNSVIIETGSPDSELPSELALARNGIVRRSGSQWTGTGPFAGKFDPGKHLTLTANDQYWAGRPFLDSVEVDFGVNDRDGMTALDLGKADVVRIPPEDIQRLRAQDHTVIASDPSELMALVFPSGPASDLDARVRTIIAESLDTTAISNVVLQGGAEPIGALLPNWLSGYAFVFTNPTEHPPHAEASLRPLSLSYDASDSIARVVAERILLNARDRGLAVQLTTAGNAEMKLVRLPLASADPRLALIELAKALELPPPKFPTDSIEDLYRAERSLLEAGRVIPLLHTRNAVAVRANVRGLSMYPDGRWNLGSVWLAPEKP